MKKKQFRELKTKNIDELAKKVEDLEKETTTARVELNMGKVKNVHVAKNKKRDIAQLKTIIRMKQLAQNKSNDSKLAKEQIHVAS